MRSDSDDLVLDRVNADWLEIVERADVFELLAILGAIEDWYVPVAAFFEAEYRRRGFSGREVETYSVHRAADAWHSNASLSALERHEGRLDPESLARYVAAAFETARVYDARKPDFADWEGAGWPVRVDAAAAAHAGDAREKD
jgi:hypothetical protein